MAEVNNSEDKQLSKTTPQAPVTPENKQTVAALETLSDAANLVQRYAISIVGNARAHEFATHVAIMAQQNPKLRDCDPLSIVRGMMACVRLNLMPNTPDQYVALIPYGKDLQFQIMYRGLAQLAYNTGVVNKIDAQLVFPEDEWSIEEGSDRKLVHKWTAASLGRDRTKSDEALFVYATAVLNTGEKAFAVMTQSEIKQIRDQAVKATGDDTPWKKWPAEQYKKTVVKRFSKLLPKSDTDSRLAYAVTLDNLSEAGKLNLDPKTGDIIEGELVSDAEELTRRRIAAAQAKRNAINGAKVKPKAVETQNSPADNEASAENE